MIELSKKEIERAGLEAKKLIKIIGTNRTAIEKIEALDLILEGWYKDYIYTPHCRRTRGLTTLIAKEMIRLELPEYEKLTNEYIEKMGYSVLLHDAGKICVPEEIRNKMGNLTDSEWPLMRKHVLYMDYILESIGLDELREVVKYHHERWDGKTTNVKFPGYPDGLKGMEIPLCARIIRVADTYDTMISHRKYRKTKFSHDGAMREIRRMAGSEMDPNVVMAFEQLYNSRDIEKVYSGRIKII